MSLSLMAKTFSPSKSGWYYKVKLHMFVKEWTVITGQYPVFRGGWFCETSFAKKC
jgi:glucan-binding YG repeat protein